MATLAWGRVRPTTWDYRGPDRSGILSWWSPSRGFGVGDGGEVRGRLGGGAHLQPVLEELLDIVEYLVEGMVIVLEYNIECTCRGVLVGYCV